MSLARAMQPLLEASARKKEKDTPNGLHNPLSIRRRCAEDDPVNVRVMVSSPTEAVVAELHAIDSTSQNSELEGMHSTSQNGT